LKAELLPQFDAPYVEKPWHRLAVKLHLEGWTNHMIAEELRQSVADVSALLTSKDMRNTIAKAIGADEKIVAKILEAAGLDSIYRLISLRDNASSDSVKFNAAKTLLEHGFGKALARVKTFNTDESEDPLGEAERLTKELLQTKEA
jgi:hypothetical protein